jgi:hypothetical protein
VGDGDAVVMCASERTLTIAVAQMMPERLAYLLRTEGSPALP